MGWWGKVVPVVIRYLNYFCLSVFDPVILALPSPGPTQRVVEDARPNLAYGAGEFEIAAAAYSDTPKI